jgi:hypothetical protein
VRRCHQARLVVELVGAELAEQPDGGAVRQRRVPGLGQPSNPRFASGGSLAIGRGKVSGVTTNFLTGAVSDVRVYESAATGFDAGILAAGDPAQPVGIGAPTASDADRTLNQTVLSQPALRPVIVALGANDLLASRSTTRSRRS